jgi:large subunit ribosomal protein L9
MAHSEILLLEKVDNLGSEGDVVKVRAGYARNFLLPRSKAVPLNQANLKRLDALKIARAAREAEELQNAQDIAAKLGELTIAIAVKTGTGGKLFGSVTAQQIIEKVSEKGFSLDKIINLVISLQDLLDGLYLTKISSNQVQLTF